MRGFLSSAVKAKTSDNQNAFRKLSRARRSKLAKAAQTTLVKADQWARGAGVAQEVADALERAFGAMGKKKK
ncbi:MAG: hypothetical protein U0235_23100 [Polyangiaceae bacterium]